MTTIDQLKDFDSVWAMSEEDAYRHLGMASLGNTTVAESVHSMRMLTAAAADSNGTEASRALGDGLLEKGKEYFQWLWKGLKEIVCTIYKGKIAIEKDQDLAKYLVDIVVTAGKITLPLAALVISTAVKLGLDKLCPT